MRVYYNEFDPQAAAWIRELIKTGLIPAGDVDERSIEDVTPNELRGYNQCHFFAGIGGWAYALDLAGWPRDRPVWTGSCPCQPFSAAGKGAGFEDERHLWPAWQHLIAQCRPSVVFGEQVASKDALEWFDLVSSDLEGSGYAVAAADLCAAGVGAPHIRQRLFFTALSDAPGDRWEAEGQRPEAGHAARVLQLRSEQETHWQHEPPAFWLPDGVPPNLVALRGFGNAIVPQVAAQFVMATVESIFSVAVPA